jgi:hypothetical protein
MNLNARREPKEDFPVKSFSLRTFAFATAN